MTTAQREAFRAEMLRSPDALETFAAALRNQPENFRTMQDAVRRRPAECPVCGTTVESFLPFGVARVTPDRKCPSCGSLERHRLIWLYFRERTNLFTDRLTMLHIAPEPWFGKRLRAHSNLQYVSADLNDPTAMVRMDLRDIPLADESVNVIYASHVLEHIDDDVRAMRELRRVLARDGWAVLQVPIRGEVTLEDPSVTDPDERTRLFGQFDHVRLYGRDGEYERRLTAAGFNVKVDRFRSELGREQALRYRLSRTEDVYFCTNAGPGGSPAT